MKKLCCFGVIMFSFLLFESCQNSGSKDSRQRADSVNHAVQPMADKGVSDFMVDAAMIDLNEIKLGSLAQQKTNNQRIQDFAVMIEKDHKKINGQLEAIAKSENVELPDSLDQEHQSNATDLGNKNSNDFNKAFMEDMVKGHKKAIDEYMKAQRKVSESDIKAFIKNTLPELQKHLDSAQAIQEALKK